MDHAIAVKQELQKISDELEISSLKVIESSTLRHSSNLDSSSQEETMMVGFPQKLNGIAHLGNSANLILKDAYVRYSQMNGENVRTSIGINHGAIECENVLDQQKSKYEASVEDFSARVFSMANKNEKYLQSQLDHLGVNRSSSPYFHSLKSETKALVDSYFVTLYSLNKIYRKPSMINWSYLSGAPVPESDIKYINIKGRTMMKIPGYDEQIEFGVINEIIYKVENSEESLIIATTKPETMFADVAIAVHPDDKRYQHLHGKNVIHPINGKLLPVICDDQLVDVNFGTGAVRLAPSNNLKDYEIGLKHGLEFVQIFNADGTLNESCGAEWEGLKRLDSRSKIISFLKEKKLFIDSKDNPMRLQISKKTQEVIEKRLHSHWWLKKEACCFDNLSTTPISLKDKLEKKVSKLGDLMLTDEKSIWKTNTTPSYFIKLEGGTETHYHEARYWVVGHDIEEATSLATERFKGHKFELIKDPDNLGTWFLDSIYFVQCADSLSKKTRTIDLLIAAESDLDKVAKALVVCDSLEINFKEMYFHPIITDFKERKLSKSLANSFDPMLLTEGADTSAITKNIQDYANLNANDGAKLAKEFKSKFPKGFSSFGGDVLRINLLRRLGRGSASQFNNLTELENDKKSLSKINQFLKRVTTDLQIKEPSTRTNFNLTKNVDIWMFVKLQMLFSSVKTSMTAKSFDTVVDKILDFWLNTLDGVYYEIIKKLPSGTESTEFLIFVVESALKITHPVAPFITEEFWHKLRGEQSPSIALSKFSVIDSSRMSFDSSKSAEIDSMLQLVKFIKSSLTILGKFAQDSLTIITNDANDYVHLNKELVSFLVRKLSNVSVIESSEQLASSNHISVEFDDKVKLLFIINGDISQESTKLKAKSQKLAKKRDSLRNLQRGKGANAARVDEIINLEKEIDLINLIEKSLSALDI